MQTFSILLTLLLHNPFMILILALPIKHATPVDQVWVPEAVLIHSFQTVYHKAILSLSKAHPMPKTTPMIMVMEVVCSSSLNVWLTWSTWVCWTWMRMGLLSQSLMKMVLKSLHFLILLLYKITGFGPSTRQWQHLPRLRV
jgi:hypothetical protein